MHLLSPQFASKALYEVQRFYLLAWMEGCPTSYRLSAAMLAERLGSRFPFICIVVFNRSVYAGGCNGCFVGEAS